MIDKLFIATVVWLASNKTGRKIAVNGYKTLSKFGGQIVKRLPNDISEVFIETEELIKNIRINENKQ